MNPVEWSQAQDLLVKLVQILTPLTEDRSVPASFFLNKRFFIPPANEEVHPFHFRHPVRLLTTLHSVQKEVEKWTFSQTQTVEKEKKPDQPALSKTPLNKQAQQLVHQVQEAIGKLCNSAQMKNPEEGLLRETLKHLKPSLDRMIEAVTHEGMHLSSDGPPPTFRFSIPRSSREQIIQKAISFPDATPSIPLRTTPTPAHAQPMKAVVPPHESEPTSPNQPMPAHAQPMKAIPLPPDKANRTLPNEPKPDLASPAPRENDKKEDPKPLPERVTDERGGDPLLRPIQLPAVPVDRAPSTPKGHEKEGVSPRSIERTSLPGAPFLADTRNLTLTRKKKKRKGFWFRDEEEDRNNP